MTAQDVIRRLCQLQAEVAEELDPNFTHAADCFCGESGFQWSRDNPRYRNDLEAVNFIIKATRRELYRKSKRGGKHR